MQVDAIEWRGAALTMQVDAIECPGDAIRLQGAALTMQVDAIEWPGDAIELQQSKHRLGLY